MPPPLSPSIGPSRDPAGKAPGALRGPAGKAPSSSLQVLIFCTVVFISDPLKFTLRSPRMPRISRPPRSADLVLLPLRWEASLPQVSPPIQVSPNHLLGSAQARSLRLAHRRARFHLPPCHHPRNPSRLLGLLLPPQSGRRAVRLRNASATTMTRTITLDASQLFVFLSIIAFSLEIYTLWNSDFDMERNFTEAEEIEGESRGGQGTGAVGSSTSTSIDNPNIKRLRLNISDRLFLR